jgi:multiple sugar transport system permease protein
MNALQTAWRQALETAQKTGRRAVRMAQTTGRRAAEAAKTTGRHAVVKRAKRLASAAFHYLVLLSLSYVFLFPLFYMLSKSMMQTWDVADATVQWIPKKLDFANYAAAFRALNYWQGFANSVIEAVGSGLLQMVSCAIVGYGFARYRFPGHGLFLSLVVFTFLVPPQSIVVPLFIFFSDLGWIDTHLPFMVPSLFGHGLKGALFVLIFIQFFRRMPGVLEEAARIDGAGALRTFWAIMFPLARPAMLVVFLFSFVWHWNDIFEPSLYLRVPTYYNLAQRMAVFFGDANLAMQQMAMQTSADVIGVAPTTMNQMMAAMVLTVLPILLVYLVLQRYFVESVERTGIAGE